MYITIWDNINTSHKSIFLKNIYLQGFMMILLLYSCNSKEGRKEGSKDKVLTNSPEETSAESDHQQFQESLSDSSLQANKHQSIIQEFSQAVLPDTLSAYQDSTFWVAGFEYDTLTNGNDLRVKLFLNNNTIYDSKEVLPVFRFLLHKPKYATEVRDKGILAHIIGDTTYAKAWYFEPTLKTGKYLDQTFYGEMTIPREDGDTTLVFEKEFVLIGE